MTTVAFAVTPHEELLHVDAAAAVMVTGPDGGTGGALYVALDPLAVWYGVTEPQLHGLFASAHCTDHCTPPGGVLSFATAAITCTLASAATDAGGCCRKLTLGGIAVILIESSPGLPPGFCDFGVAAIVTSPPVGISGGAV